MQSIFKRHEKKYLVTKEQAELLQDVIMQHAEIDQYGEYLVQNLYYDTANWDIIQKSIKKPLYKEKLRLRFYGHYDPESQGFLELKKKYNGIVYKRRIAFKLGELNGLNAREIASALDSQISREIRFFLQSNHVSEKVHIAYKRTAYSGIKDRDLRITFDRDIFFRLSPLGNYSFAEYNPDADRQILGQNQMLMEIKISGAMPLWLSHALSENKIFSVSFSKFGNCYTKHIINQQSLKEEKNAA
ncbi:MAG: polyphosphate polymerase domain-containing protein [Treponema sp.]|nr:polyphosphate polymerase domain-containing protein [Treponema sp.]